MMAASCRFFLVWRNKPNQNENIISYIKNLKHVLLTNMISDLPLFWGPVTGEQQLKQRDPDLNIPNSLGEMNYIT